MVSESLARAYELTCSIAAAVESDEWQLASDLVEERSPLIMALGPDQDEASLATIRAIQETDAAIMGRAHAAHAAITDEFSDAKQRIAAAGFYQSTGQLR